MTELGLFRRIADGLTRTASKLGDGLTGLTKQRLDPAALRQLEDLLVEADLGSEAAKRVVAAIAKQRSDRPLDEREIKTLVAAEIERVLAPVARPFSLETERKPFVILIVGVNGSGKTTTIGKLASLLNRQKKRVLVAAADTFRAAAIDQLMRWTERAGVGLVAGAPRADPAGVAFEAHERALREASDVLLIDTAGRLQNKSALMAELTKIVRVLKKLDGSAPHAVLLVLDATVGQNALSQVATFKEIAGVTGLVVAKLDGTAKAGILVALAERFGLPVHFIGLGEAIEDLSPFDAKSFAEALVGLRESAAPS